MEVMSELSEAHGNTQRYLQYIRGRGIHNYCQYVAFGISRLASLDDWVVRQSIVDRIT
jgi:hypothetical protein